MIQSYVVLAIDFIYIIFSIIYSLFYVTTYV